MRGLIDRLEVLFVKQATELARGAASEAQEQLAEVLAELEERTAELEHARARLMSPDSPDRDPRVEELARRLTERESAVLRARQEVADAERRAEDAESALRGRDAELAHAQARVRECETLLELVPFASERLAELAELEARREQTARATADLRRREQQLTEIRTQIHQAELRLEAEADRLERLSRKLEERETLLTEKEVRARRFLDEVQASLRR